MGRPPPQMFGGPSPSPPRSPPLLRAPNILKNLRSMGNCGQVTVTRLGLFSDDHDCYRRISKYPYRLSLIMILTVAIPS